jgi:uncharacterized protein (TIGR02466 family)
MSRKQITGIFPVPVGLYEFHRELTEKEKKFLFNLEKIPNDGNTTSKNNYILENKKCKKIKKFLEESVNDFFIEIMKPKFDVSLRITQSWLNYSEKTQYHHSHIHPNSYFSGVFYLQAEKTTDKIFFNKHDTVFNKVLTVYSEEYNLYNSDSWYFENYTGLLVIFPSTLNHNVLPVQHESTRISLSFNTFPKGKLGNPVSLTECML